MSIRQKSSTATVAAIIGTILEYYDASLYSFMAPMLVSIFLPTMDKVSALILTFIMPVMGIFIRPLGALVIGRIGDKYGRKRALIISITGMTLVTLMLGLTPTYSQVGVVAPVLFLLLRVSQGFFVAGEYNGGAIFILEHANSKHPGFLSGVYTACASLGIFVASLVSTCVSYLPAEYWRAPYLLGFVLGIVGLCFRRYVKESPKFLQKARVEGVPLRVIAAKYKLLIASILVAVYLSVTYTMPTILMNSLLPLVTSYSLSTIMSINTGSTLLAIVLFPLFGHLGDKISPARSMMIAAGLMVVAVYPLMRLISSDVLGLVIGVKVCLTVLSVWFEAPFHAWTQSLFGVRERYTAISFTYSVGSQISAAMMPLSLWLWKYTGSIMPVCAIIAFWAVVALGVLIMRDRFSRQ